MSAFYARARNVTVSFIRQSTGVAAIASLYETTFRIDSRSPDARRDVIYPPVLVNVVVVFFTVLNLRHVACGSFRVGVCGRGLGDDGDRVSDETSHDR